MSRVTSHRSTKNRLLYRVGLYIIVKNPIRVFTETLYGFEGAWASEARSVQFTMYNVQLKYEVQQVAVKVP